MNYLFLFGDEPSPLWVADVDGSGASDISDVTLLVNYMFGTGTTLNCQP